MRDDRGRGAYQHLLERVDLGTRQRRRDEWDVMVGDAVRSAETPRLIRGKLAGVLVVGAVVDDRLHTRAGKLFDIVAAQCAGYGQAGSELHQMRHEIAPLRLGGASAPPSAPYSASADIKAKRAAKLQPIANPSNRQKSG